MSRPFKTEENVVLLSSLEKQLYGNSQKSNFNSMLFEMRIIQNDRKRNLFKILA